MGNCLKSQNISNQVEAPVMTPVMSIQEMSQNAVDFVVPINSGHCISVYDGDTITITSNLNINGNNILYKFKIRIRGIDCPEIRTSNTIEKKQALIAKDAVYKLCYGKLVVLKNVGSDKYGRVLADVFVDNINVGQHLLDNMLAVKYDGKTKKKVEY